MQMTGLYINLQEAKDQTQASIETKKLQRIAAFAEREGFEPSVQLPIQRFSRPSHSTALAPFRVYDVKAGCKNKGIGNIKSKIEHRLFRSSGAIYIFLHTGNLLPGTQHKHPHTFHNNGSSRWIDQEFPLTVFDADTIDPGSFPVHDLSQ